MGRRTRLRSQKTQARKETKASWERAISERDQRIKRCGDRKPGSKKMGRNGKEERDDSSEVNLINRMGEKLLFRNRRRGDGG